MWLPGELLTSALWTLTVADLSGTNAVRLSELPAFAVGRRNGGPTMVFDEQNQCVVLRMLGCILLAGTSYCQYPLHCRLYILLAGTSCCQYPLHCSLYILLAGTSCCQYPLHCSLYILLPGTSCCQYPLRCSLYGWVVLHYKA